MVVHRGRRNELCFDPGQGHAHRHRGKQSRKHLMGGVFVGGVWFWGGVKKKHGLISSPGDLILLLYGGKGKGVCAGGRRTREKGNQIQRLSARKKKRGVITLFLEGHVRRRDGEERRGGTSHRKSSPEGEARRPKRKPCVSTSVGEKQGEETREGNPRENVEGGRSGRGKTAL